MYLFFYWILDFWLSVFPAKKEKTGLALVRIDAIGDFILWLDTAKKYRELYNGVHIVLIANSAWAQWAESFPFWDEVWSLDLVRFTQSPVYRVTTMHRIRKAGFDVVIHPIYSRSFHGDSIVRASAATKRIGSRGDESNIRQIVKILCNHWYTQLVSATNKNLMELERNAEFFSGLSGQSIEADLPRLNEKFITKVNLPWPGDYIVLFPGAAWHGRRWPITYFSRVAVELHATHGWPVVLCGGLSDFALCKRLGDELNVPFVNLAGKTNLAELAGVIYHSRLLISNETSAVHIAAAFGKTTICILGGGHHGRFLPYPRHLAGIKPIVADHPMPCFNCNWKCYLPHDRGGPVPCIETISVKHVLALVSKSFTN